MYLFLNTPESESRPSVILWTQRNGLYPQRSSGANYLQAEQDMKLLVDSLPLRIPVAGRTDISASKMLPLRDSPRGPDVLHHTP